MTDISSKLSIGYYGSNCFCVHVYQYPLTIFLIHMDVFMVDDLGICCGAGITNYIWLFMLFVYSTMISQFFYCPAGR